MVSEGKPGHDVELDAVELLRALIRIDTTNAGESPDTVGEALAAEYVEQMLTEVGYAPERFSTDQSHRQGVVLRIPGRDSSAGALLLHGHLDVVPARAQDWSVPPFAAEVLEVGGEQMIYGRGAVDMKDMDAMILAVVRGWAREGYTPPRDVVVMLLPDEEAGSLHGGHWLVDNRPELFTGVTEAVGEVGGFSVQVRDDLRFYMVQTAEKGIEWMRITARGSAGHGSFINRDNAVTKLAEAVARVGNHEFPIVLTPTIKSLLAELSDALGIELDPNDMQATLAKLGPAARLVGATIANTANPTMLDAGYKHNVIPSEASANIDGRYLPGQKEAFLAEVDSLLGEGIVRETLVGDIAIETPFEGSTIEAMGAALRAEDPNSRIVPYMLSGGTDLKAFTRLGIRGYGFAPLLLPADLDFASLFHGVDERVPASSVQFGVRVLDRFVRSL
jgi:acetylornithine deacetylase/succinyl-diaminopimelate desuccinylase-like protein